MIDVLIPTYNRAAGLAVLLASLAGQDRRDFNVIVADQSDAPVAGEPAIEAVVRWLELKGHAVTIVRNLPRRGIAQQRQLLLDLARARHVLYLDDDLILEPWVVGQMADALRSAGCGFVGSGVIGLSFVRDHRPDQQAIEFWEGGAVSPERIAPGDRAWARHRLHNAANLLHVQRALGLTPDATRLYKIAWVGACVLYDAERLRAAGGFDFWADLPREHVGEDVLAQLRVMARWGGAGVIPSGVYHQEAPTTLPVREFDAPRVLAVHG